MIKYENKYIHLFEEYKIKWHIGKGKFEEEIIDDIPEDSDRLILCNVFGNQYLLDEKYLYEGEIVLYNVYFMKTGKKEDFNFMKVNLNAEVLIFSPSKGNFEGFKNCYSIPSEEIKSRIVVIKDYVINEKLNKNI